MVSGLKSKDFHERLAELGMTIDHPGGKEKRDGHGSDFQDCKWHRQSEQPRLVY
jgi:hypothetical protein